MARPKKTEGPPPPTPAVAAVAAGAATAPAPAVLQISVDEFLRTRNSVVTGLASLQSAVQDLSRAYLLHTNTVLGQPGGLGLEPLAVGNPLVENPLLAAQPPPPPPPLARGASPAARSEAGDTKQRKKKRAHDPNAPKRPLTPFFLYMQTARPVIASDLGEGAKKGDVSNEGTRRWQAMPEDQKQLWKDAYAKNLAEYQDRVVAYKQTLGGADPAAAQLVVENGIAGGDLEAPADEEEEVPPAAPSPPKRRKGAKEAKTTPAQAAAATVTPAAAAPAPAKETVVAPPAGAAAGKKRGRRSKAADEEAEAPGKSPPKAEKEKRSRKKRKSDVEGA